MQLARIDAMLPCRWLESADDGLYEPWSSADATALVYHQFREVLLTPMDSPQAAVERIRLSRLFCRQYNPVQEAIM